MIKDVNIILDIEHTFSGDLTLLLQSPSGTVVGLVERSGTNQPYNNGCCGNPNGLVKGLPITFDDDSEKDPEVSFESGGTYFSIWILWNG